MPQMWTSDPPREGRESADAVLPRPSDGAEVQMSWFVRAHQWLCKHRGSRVRERRDDGGLDGVCPRCGHRTLLVGKVPMKVMGVGR